MNSTAELAIARARRVWDERRSQLGLPDVPGPRATGRGPDAKPGKPGREPHDDPPHPMRHWGYDMPDGGRALRDRLSKDAGVF